MGVRGRGVEGRRGRGAGGVRAGGGGGEGGRGQGGAVDRERKGTKYLFAVACVLLFLSRLTCAS